VQQVEDQTTWSSITARGELRVIVHESGAYVPRSGSPDDRELAAIELFARAKGLKIRLIHVAERSRLLDTLVSGQGDIIAAHLTNTPSRRKRAQFTAPLRTVKELIVVPKTTVNAPASVDDLAGRTIYLRPSSSYLESIVNREFKTPPRIRPLSESLDALDILAAVGRGEIPLTVMDSDAVNAYLAYREDIAVAATLTEDAPIAWAVRKDDNTLHHELNTFIADYISVSGVAPVAALDLDDIQARGVLRMVIPNTGAAFFFHQGVPMGFQYVMAQKLCRKLGVRLEVVVPRKKTDMLPLLVEGHADVIAATMTATADRRELVDFAEPLMRVDEVLIQRAEQPAVQRVSELSGRTIIVQKNSSYLRTLVAIKASVPGLTVQTAPSGTTSEALINGVANGTYDLTVSDFNLVAAELSYRRDIVATLKVGRGRPIAYAVHKSSVELKKALDEFSQYWAPQLSGGTITAPTTKTLSTATTLVHKQLPALLASIRERYQLPKKLLHRWMMEVSGGNPASVSWFGARGLLHVMPHVAAQWNIQANALHEPKTGLDAGARWLMELLKKLPRDIEREDALKMALAATRVGFGHISDARELATRRGWNAKKWGGHVARALSELTRPEIAAGARYGYCPGTEAVRFVSKVFSD